MKKLIVFIFLILSISISIPLYADPFGGDGFGDKGIEITEEDGSPDDWPSILKFNDGTLTDNGDGSFSHDIDGYGGATYLKLDCSNDPLTGDLDVGNNALVVDTTTLVVNATSYEDKVGIGTATPGSKLDVRSSTYPVTNIQRDVTAGSGLLYGAAKLTLTNTTPTANNGIAFYFTAPDDGGTDGNAGLFGGRLSTITAGSEIGELIFEPAFHQEVVNGSYPGLTLQAVSATQRDAYFPTGNVGIGTTDPTGIYANTKLAIEGSGIKTVTISTFDNDTAVNSGGVIMTRARGTQGSPAQVVDGDRVGFFLSGGMDTDGDYQYGAGINFYVDGDPTTSNVPTEISFETGGAYPRKSRIEIKNDSNIRFPYDGTTTDYANMLVSANGATSITTVDSDGALGHISIVPDGFIGLMDAGTPDVEVDIGTSRIGWDSNAYITWNAGESTIDFVIN